MIPVQVPIVDYENPCYCPEQPFQLHSDSPDVDLAISPPPATLAYNHKGVKNRNFDTGTSSPSIRAFVYGQNRITNNDPTKGPVVGRQLVSIPCDSSPCASFPSSLHKFGPVRKRAMYTSSAKEPVSFGIPDGKLCSIKQEYSSPVLLASSDQDERLHQSLKECYEISPGNLFDLHPEIPSTGPPLPGRLTDLAFALENGVKDGVTTRTLLLRLDEVFPRTGFKEAAESVEHMWPETNSQHRAERHQALVDLLGERGALNEYVLAALHDAEFRCLDLGPTMRGVNELVLPRGDVMRVFSEPGWFKHLKTLSFTGGRFRDDFSLSHIQPLCQVEKLVLANTGIGNEGIFHIVALKHKLRYLDLSGNLLISDDSVPALVLLENLQHLSIFGTGILMHGLRKLAVALKEGERVMDIKIPNTCQDYIDGMHKQYLLYPTPPLISDPGIICMLSKTALSRNLEAHAAINSSIVSTGPQDEMEERLGKILEVRNHDLVVREMLVGQDGAK
ncbi:hypothetical protein L210DRAFT_929211 [Boletus edulis BED1]|uniref:Uncharacterized protein n=1 Tax=Boletus edulis BED1 TaxID=1328754 RepID=A0AAD4BWY2_BOLED|nr:hypothetical protein L210DRAFT_929211 [Boletus edulis BED1]